MNYPEIILTKTKILIHHIFEILINQSNYFLMTALCRVGESVAARSSLFTGRWMACLLCRWNFDLWCCVFLKGVVLSPWTSINPYSSSHLTITVHESTAGHSSQCEKSTIGCYQDVTQLSHSMSSRKSVKHAKALRIMTRLMRIRHHRNCCLSCHLVVQSWLFLVFDLFCKGNIWYRCLQ